LRAARIFLRNTRYTGTGAASTLVSMKHFHTALRARWLPRIAAALLLAGAATQAAAVITIDTVAGVGTSGYSGDGNLATAAELYGPRGVVMDRSGRLYISDSDNNVIRRVKTDGTIETIAGGLGGSTCVGTNYDPSDEGALATNAHLSCPTGLALDVQGNLYIADTHNHRIRKVDASTGTITTVAGTGTGGYNGDGILATNAQLNKPFEVAVDTQGRVYISDQNNRRVRRIETDGTLTTVAGDGSVSETGNGGQATSAGLGGIWGIGLDAQDRLYITNVGSVRRVEADGTINRVAGNGSGSYGGDSGPALAAGMVATGIMVDASGRMYIADSSQRVRRVGLDGIINTVAGTGATGFSGDGGDALVAVFNGIYGLTLGTNGLLYFPDYSNHRIRALTLDVPTEPLTASAIAGNAQATVSWSAPSGDGGSPITGYVVTVVGDPSKSCTVAPPATSCVVTGLTNGTAYTFAVRADNANGAGAEAEAGPVTPSAPPVPSAPLNPAAVAGNSQATVSWDEPASNGPFTLYTVTAVEDPSKTCTATPPATSCVVTGLTNGSTYTFKVSADNANGTGADSAASNAVTPTAPPPAPTVTAISPAMGSVAGGAVVTITGTDFTGATAVTVGGNACTSVTVLSATSLSCTVPTGTAGPASVVVTTPGGANTANTLYSYLAVTSSGGGVTADITGGTCAGFENGTAQFTAPSNPPAGQSFPYGVFGFTALSCGTGGTVTITLTYPQALPPGTKYWKQIGGSWVDWTSQVTIAGNTVVLTLTDGAYGDTNPLDGVISDPSGPAVPLVAGAGGATAIPTLSEWALLALSALMALAMAVTLRRRGV
jgi:hypothetical protein